MQVRARAASFTITCMPEARGSRKCRSHTLKRHSRGGSHGLGLWHSAPRKQGTASAMCCVQSAASAVHWVHVETTERQHIPHWHEGRPTSKQMYTPQHMDTIAGGGGGGGGRGGGLAVVRRPFVVDGSAPAVGQRKLLPSLRSLSPRRDQAIINPLRAGDTS